jgi:hypothetical protein
MKTTQIHLIDPSAGMVLVTCADGSRVVFGSQVGIGTQNEVLQRLFEVLEDGGIDYFVHTGVEVEGSVSIAAIDEFFSVKQCMERACKDVDWPQAYVNFRGERSVELVEADDVMEFGETQIRLLAADAPRPTADGRILPVAMRVSHGEDNAASSVLCPGATNGLDWLDIAAGDVETFASAGLVIDGMRPLDMIVTARQKGMVSAEHLRLMKAGTVLLGANPDGENVLRVAARELYGHFTGQNPGGAGLIEVKASSWLTLHLDGKGARLEEEARPLGKVA